jgi:uncharacterized YccA/Bax inhibitor family protein
MSLFSSSNPALKDKVFRDTILADVVSTHETMSVKGTIRNFGFLFLLTMVAAFYTWNKFAAGSDVTTLMYVGIFGGLGVALVIVFKKEWSAFLAPAYALLKGLGIGAISAYYNSAFEKVAPNIVMQAIGLTFGVVIAMYLLYNFKVIRATERFKSIIFTATAGIMIFYLISFGLSFAGVRIGFLHEGSAMGIGFSLLVVGLAAMNLIIDFDMIEQGAAMGAPKYMEWYGAFGLLVTIIWLYLELLRLLSKLASRK